jgi:t-SNARE complex subunit (syntaxin)
MFANQVQYAHSDLTQSDAERSKAMDYETGKKIRDKIRIVVIIVALVLVAIALLMSWISGVPLIR